MSLDYCCQKWPLRVNTLTRYVNNAQPCCGCFLIEGRGVSTWDLIRKQPGVIADNSSPSQSCEAYDHYKEDVRFLKELNVSHYRFFICWTRILPNGTTSNINEKGISFYRSLIEELKANSIEPIAVLFHADYPFELYQRGGWLNPECIQWYLDFCQLCFERFGDLVRLILALRVITKTYFYFLFQWKIKWHY
ncbi:hypothetical protein Y032_0336g2890 [Ancylostoma ceylanicum]|uniref:Glycosyl hydrolase, family 1 n=1 Tax=Ancylostoma ceylanicum TaxID=53326 RepID=A0A016RYH4_9BILA|nr:hypothetical protein Y032_0336g2890 [Ancylostoma ceylanicum]